MILHDLARSWLDVRSAIFSSTFVLKSAWAYEYYDIMFELYPRIVKLKVQDGLPTESL